MMKKSDYYRLNVRDIKFWVRDFNEDDEEVYAKGSLTEDYYLYIERIKDNKYIDYITSRVFTMEEDGDYLVLWPSGIKVPKVCLEVCNDIEMVSMEISDDKEFEYFIISEGILYDNYFCNEIAHIYELDIIPATYIDEYIDYIICDYGDTVDKGRRLVQ